MFPLSAPQIRYPDCYGIDMAKMGDFIAFNAAVQLLKEKGKDDVLTQVYKECLEQIKPQGRNGECKNNLPKFVPEEISTKISELLTPKNTVAKVKIIYQSIEDLHASCPNHQGDWYFTGNYPTPGGNKVVNQAYINYYNGINERGLLTNLFFFCSINIPPPPKAFFF